MLELTIRFPFRFRIGGFREFLSLLLWLHRCSPLFPSWLRAGQDARAWPGSASDQVVTLGICQAVAPKGFGNREGLGQGSECERSKSSVGPTVSYTLSEPGGPCTESPAPPLVQGGDSGRFRDPGGPHPD